MSKRKKTTMSGTPRDEKNYGLREFLDDYGPVSNFIRLLKGHDEKKPAMPPGLGGKGFDAINPSSPKGRKASGSAEKPD